LIAWHPSGATVGLMPPCTNWNPSIFTTGCSFGGYHALNFGLRRLGLVDELQVFVAPLIFGGATSPSLADGAGFPRELAPKLERTDVEVYPDGGVLLRYKVNRRE